MNFVRSAHHLSLGSPAPSAEAVRRWAAPAPAAPTPAPATSSGPTSSPSSSSSWLPRPSQHGGAGAERLLNPLYFACVRATGTTERRRTGSRKGKGRRERQKHKCGLGMRERERESHSLIGQKIASELASDVRGVNTILCTMYTPKSPTLG